MKFKVLFILLICGLYACKNDSGHSDKGFVGYKVPFKNPTKLEDSLYTAIMEVHDETMPLMNKITTLQTHLKEKKAAIPIDESDPNTEIISRLIGELNKSENMMWAWMDDFKKIHDLDRDKVTRFLIENEFSVNVMKDQMNNSITNANNFLQIKE